MKLSMNHLALTMMMCGALAGCSDDATTDDTVEATINVVDFTDSAVESADVCVRETGECATSDGSGVLRLALPPNADLTMTFDAPGMFPLLYAGRSAGEDGTVEFTMFQTALLEAAFETVDVTLDAAKGHLIHGVSGPGTTVSISPNSGTGALYGDNGVADPEAESIPDSGNPGWGWGNVDPGPVTINLTPAEGASCAENAGITGSTETSIETAVEAGRLTVVPVANCTGE